MLQHLPIFAAVLLLSTAAVTTNPDPMSQAAVQFKNSLTKEQRKELCLPFLGDERANWSVLPYGEAGVRFSALHTRNHGKLSWSYSVPHFPKKASEPLAWCANWTAFL